MGIQTFVFFQRLNWNSPPYPGADNFPRQNARLRSNHGPALHANVIAESYLAADNAVVFDNDAAADAGLPGNDNALADIAVVTDVNQVVEFRAPADARTAQRSAIHTGVRAQLDLVFDHYGADLREFMVALVVAHKAKPVRADHHAGMQNHSIPDGHVVIDDDVGMDDTVAVNLNVVSDAGPGMNLRAHVDAAVFTDGNVRADESS